jgi:hypothetical protein
MAFPCAPDRERQRRAAWDLLTAQKKRSLRVSGVALDEFYDLVPKAVSVHAERRFSHRLRTNTSCVMSRLKSGSGRTGIAVR